MENLELAVTKPKLKKVTNKNLFDKALKVDVPEEIKDSSPSIDDLVNTSPLKKKYVFMEDTIKALEMALITHKNIILFGKGGHGKSELSVDFFAQKKIDPYVITMGSGTTTDKLFGGIDLKLFNEQGKIEYLVDNSFMNEEYVIFEELFDAPDYILEQLKDILSSGVFRNGTQRFPIKTKLIICCTNKTREQFSKNDSLKALMERFPLEHEVKWGNYNATTYEYLLKHVRGYADPMLTYILQEYAKGGIIISPRIAITAADMLERCGPDCLNFIADFNVKKDLLANAIKKFNSIYEIKEIEDALLECKINYEKLKLDSEKEIANAEVIMKTIQSKVSKLSTIKADDSLVTKTSTLINTYTNFVSECLKDLVLLKKMETIDE